VNFRVITLREPPKAELIPYLDAEHQGLPPPSAPTRSARVEIIVKASSNKSDLIELIVDLDSRTITKQQHLEGKHSYIDSAYMKEVEKACNSNCKVQDEIKKLDLPQGASVIIEPWAYATDGSNDMSRRITMVSPNPSQ
jgi:primary-amine oxidase